MKKNLLILATLLCAAVTFSCCSSSDDNNDNPGPGPQQSQKEQFTKTYFSVPNATFKDAKLPTATSTDKLPVSMNSSALAGGSNFVKLEADKLLKEIYVAVLGNDCYWAIDAAKALVTETRATAYNYQFTLDFGTEFSQNVNVQISALADDGTITAPTVTKVTYVESLEGDLAINLTFSNEKDVDLHVVTPWGFHIYYGDRGQYDRGAWEQIEKQLNELYNEFYEKYGEDFDWDDLTSAEREKIEDLERQMKEAEESTKNMKFGLDHDSNAACDIDSLNNENIVFTDEWVCNGKYEVYVDMYENCDYTTATNWTVTARYRGQVIPVNTNLSFPTKKNPMESVQNNNPVSGLFPIGEPSTEGSNDVNGLSLKVMEFEITGAPKNPEDFNRNNDYEAKTRAGVNPWKLFLTPAEKAKVEFAEFMASRNK